MRGARGIRQLDRHNCASSAVVRSSPAASQSMSDAVKTGEKASIRTCPRRVCLTIAVRLPPVLDPLARLGYFVDTSGELRHLRSRRHVKDEVALADFPENRYAELVQAIAEYLQQSMISDKTAAIDSTGRFDRIMVPSIEESLSPEARCPIFATRGWRKAKRLIVLLSSARVQAGMWSRSVSFEHGIYFGSMLPYFEMARKMGDMAVIVLNPYANSTIRRDFSSFVVKRSKSKCACLKRPSGTCSTVGIDTSALQRRRCF